MDDLLEQALYSGGAVLMYLGMWENAGAEAKVTLAALASPKQMDSSKLRRESCRGALAELCGQAKNPFFQKH